MAIDIAKMKKRLEERRHMLEADLKDDTAGPPIHDGEDPAAIEYQDKEDDATDEQEMQQEQGIRFALDSELSDVNTALQRIEEGTYGRCVGCGKEIPPQRLEAEPWALRCIQDQEKHDRLLAEEDIIRSNRHTEGTHFF